MSLLTSMFFIFGCQKNEIDTNDQYLKNGSSFDLVAQITQTKTTLDGLSVEWEDGDLLYLVTEDQEWGAPYENSENTNMETIAEYKYEDGRFSTEATISNGEHVFNAIYCRTNQKTWHRGAGSSHSLTSVQTQDCNNPTAHVKDNDVLVGTFTATTPLPSPAQVTMQHIYTMMRVDIVNETGRDLEVAKFQITADLPIAGTYQIDDFANAVVSHKSGNYNTITVNVTGGVVKKGEKLPVYFVMAPISDYKGDITFVVTDSNQYAFTKTVSLNGVTFAAGKYNTTSYTLATADPKFSHTWNLTINETSEASEEKIAWTSDIANMECVKNEATTPANNYYGGNAERTSTRFYKNSKLTITPATGKVLTYVEFIATGANYASTLAASEWANATAVAEGDKVYLVFEDGAKLAETVVGGTVGLETVTVHTEDITPQPLVMGKISCVESGSDFIELEWSAVENASGYEFGYCVGDGIQPAYSWKIGDSTGYVVTGLNPSTTYTFFVKAIGNGVFYSSSNTSQITITTAASEEIGEDGVVLYESFDQCESTGGNDGAWSGNVASSEGVNSDLASWTFVKGYNGNKCAKLGTGSLQGKATTPALGVEGNVVLTFKAGAWDSTKEKTTLLLSVEGGGELQYQTVEMVKGEWSEYEVVITGVTKSTTITFAGYQKSNSRFFLDEVKVTM